MSTDAMEGLPAESDPEPEVLMIHRATWLERLQFAFAWLFLHYRRASAEEMVMVVRHGQEVQSLRAQLESAWATVADREQDLREANTKILELESRIKVMGIEIVSLTEVCGRDRQRVKAEKAEHVLREQKAIQAKANIQPLTGEQ